MTVAGFSKDAWIADMIRKRYIIVHEDGSIHRCVKADDDGVLLSGDYRLVKPRVHKKSGRVYANFTWRGITKSLLINRIVAIRFLPNPQNLPQVNHIDGNKENNALSNLEWSSGSDNEKHAHRTGLKSGRGSANSNAKLTSTEVQEIRASEQTTQDLADRYGVGRSTIANIRRGTTWTHV
jgi:DNA-binding transcriptional regulator YiaG